MKRMWIFLLFAVLINGCGHATPATAYEENVVDSSEQEVVEDVYTVEQNTLENEPIEATSEPSYTISEDFWHVFTWTYKNEDGYILETKTTVSNLISLEAPNTATAAWTSLGGTADEIPDLYMCREIDNYWDNTYETGYYIIGQTEVNNLTEGFSFTSDKAFTYSDLPWDDGFTPGSLMGEEGIVDPLGLGFMRVIGNSGIKDFVSPNNSYLEQPGWTINFITPNMTSDKWGPYRFIIALPNKKTPNSPEGYEGLNNLYWKSYSAFYETEESFRNSGYDGDYKKVHLERIESDNNAYLTAGVASNYSVETENVSTVTVDANSIELPSQDDYWNLNYFNITKYLKDCGAYSVDSSTENLGSEYSIITADFGDWYIEISTCAYEQYPNIYVGTNRPNTSGFYRDFDYTDERTNIYITVDLDEGTMVHQVSIEALPDIIRGILAFQRETHGEGERPQVENCIY
ncbi:hypothetical protein [Butyrivibrio fibrisolvens]|uniref:hypothetical protein n=1 Tax=Butyrivibrio fibrisolvens TaxID=831 RepID=UPI0003B3AA9A|nr:hypothetical protein [Butyrivibrio fibrisolvens]